MRKALLGLAVTAAAVAGTAFALQEDDRAPVNKTCPVQVGKPIKRAFMSVHEGRPIGFCCGKCKKLFDDDPAEYAGNLPPVEAPKAIGAARLGKPAPEFQLKDTEGNLVKLSDFKEQLVVLQWTDPSCPVSQRRIADGAEAAMIAKIKKATFDRIFHFSVCSSPKVAGPEFSKFLTEAKLETRGLLDPDGKVAKAFGARVTPTAYVIDGAGILLYAGAIDNDPDGKKGEKAVNYVVEAVKSILEGKKPKPDKNPPYGTPIKGK